MRIAVSGAHRVGKTTLIEAFMRAHPEYEFEPEPYHALAEAGVAFSDPPTAEDFLEQLAYRFKRLDERSGEAKLIFDRSPLDFVAYLQAMAGRAEGAFDFDDCRGEVEDAMGALDAIVFIPIEAGGFGDAELAYPRLRKAVDRRLRAILLDDELSLFDGGRPAIVEVSGSTALRLREVERLLRAKA